MRVFRFKLNNQPMSALTHGSRSYPAFSGRGDHVNKKSTMCLPHFGAIPIGVYYVFDRESGGRLGRFRDYFLGRDTWFALYGIDEAIDDVVYCENLARGQFRLHPKSGTGRSDGCVVVESELEFMKLRASLKTSGATSVPGSDLKAYAILLVQ